MSSIVSDTVAVCIFVVSFSSVAWGGGGGGGGGGGDSSP